MLTSLKIERFRALERLNLSTLGRVNLIVGKNNTGKTSVLEAVEALCARSSPKALLRGPIRRGEFFNSIRDPDRPFERLVDIRGLFRGHRIRLLSSFELLAPSEGNPLFPDIVTLTCEVCSVLRDGTAVITDKEPTQDESSGWGLLLRRANVPSDELISISRSGGTWDEKYLPIQAQLGDVAPVVFVPAASLEAEDLLRFWDAAAFSDEQEHVHDFVRQLLPELERLGPMGADTGTTRGKAFQVKLRGDDRLIPLGSFGDGMRRLFALGLAETQAEHGVLLVDDIDTGLHHSVMRDMWRMIFQTAVRLNIQVFATTHSSDCWRSLGYLCASDPEIAKQVSVHRLERGLDHTIQYTPEELAIAAQQDIDIR